jgi:L-alanine-DL-glutamate epimerase-like enolase superfamily enzyme
VNVAAALHFLNSIPSSFICEFVAEEETTLRDHVTKQRIVATDGMLAIPDAPGLGIDLNEDAIDKYLVR